MERQPEPDFRFNLDGEVFESRPDNTIVFLHNDTEEQYDHVFLYNPNEEEVTEGYYIFRQSFENFDDVVEEMMERNYTVVHYDESKLNDRLAYFRLFPPDYKPKEITPRMEKHIAFWGYLLSKDLVTPEDFSQPGELHLLI